ncbi:hypothetical protein SNEBB_007119 [Seison nebaliae]|nr:hypothetical protein SNEBB_007119 [Seison nebaliae]
MGLFSKPDPKEQVNEWTKKLRAEGRKLDREIWGIQREEAKVTKSLKEAAKRGDKDICKILAKEIVRSHKAIAKLYSSKAHINSVMNQMRLQLSQMKMAGNMKQSADVMQSMQQLVKLPTMRKVATELSKEMMKAGIMEEMMDDTMASALGDDEDLEIEADEEVDKILYEVTKGELGKAPDAVADTLATTTTKVKGGKINQNELDEMNRRLDMLKE